MKVSFVLCAILLGLVAGCGKKEAAKAAKDDASVGGVSTATAPLDYLGAQGRAKQTAIRVTSLAEVTQAVQKFYALEDRYPRDLNELVQQHYLGALPAEPNGAHLVYNSETGEARFVRATPAQPTPASAAPGNTPKRPGLKNLPSSAAGPP